MFCRTKRLHVASLLCVAVALALLHAAPAAALPRVLIMGDSVTRDYLPYAAALLRDTATLTRAVDSGSDTDTLRRTVTWCIGEGGWDVIHFNTGLHDCLLQPDGQTRIPVDRYEDNLHVIVTQLRATGARLVWATTTPMAADDTRRNTDIIVYNAAAARVMDDHGIPTNDLYACIYPRVAELQVPHDAHFTPRGRELLGGQAARGIQAALGLPLNGLPAPPAQVLVSPLAPRTIHDLQGAASGGVSWYARDLRYDYSWRKSRDGERTWGPGPRTALLSASETTRGETWRLLARSVDGASVGKWVASASVTIANTPPPAPMWIRITPSAPAANEDLRATAGVPTDMDGDRLTFRYQWWQSPDRVTWTAGPADVVLSRSETRIGDYWKVSARCHDGYAVGPPAFSVPVRIGRVPALAMTATASSRGAVVCVTLNLTAAVQIEGTVCNLAGRTVAVLPERDLPGGLSTWLWNGLSSHGTPAPSGSYLLVLQARRGGDSASVTCPLQLSR